MGRTRGSTFVNNTVVGNDTLNTGMGQLWIQYASGNTVANNLFVAGDNQALLYNEAVNPSNSLDSNIYWASGGAANTSFLFNNVEYASFGEYQRKSRQDRGSFFFDPVFVDADNGDFRLAGGSPAVDRGSNARGRFAFKDFTGAARPIGLRPDIGAYEQATMTPALEKIVAPVGADDLYLGVYPGGKTGTEDDITAADVAAFETAAGRQTAWVNFSHNWYENRLFPAGTAAMIRDRGSIPYIRLMLRSSAEQNKAEPLFTLASLLRGTFDNDLRAWARSARNFATPLIVEFGPEMNGSWFSWNGSYSGGGRTSGYGDATLADGPERFRDAYRRIITLMRQEGAANITWVFHVNAQDIPDVAWNRFENYYPGDSFIDWLGVSAYGAQTPRDTQWPMFRDLMDAAYPRLDALSESKPIIVSEFGVTSNSPLGSAATWAADAWTDLKAGRWPRVIGASWWNEKWQNDTNPEHDTTMRLQDNAALAAAFAAQVAASTVIGRPSSEQIVTTMVRGTPTSGATTAVGASNTPTPAPASTSAPATPLVVPKTTTTKVGSRSMVRSFAPRPGIAAPGTAAPGTAAPSLAELARHAAKADDYFTTLGGG